MNSGVSTATCITNNEETRPGTGQAISLAFAAPSLELHPVAGIFPLATAKYIISTHAHPRTRRAAFRA